MHINTAVLLSLVVKTDSLFSMQEMNINDISNQDKVTHAITQQWLGGRVWLRRWTVNSLCFARASSNPVLLDFTRCHCHDPIYNDADSPLCNIICGNYRIQTTSRLQWMKMSWKSSNEWNLLLSLQLLLSSSMVWSTTCPSSRVVWLKHNVLEWKRKDQYT